MDPGSQLNSGMRGFFLLYLELPLLHWLSFPSFSSPSLSYTCVHSQPRLAWNSLCSSSWPGTCSHPPASASGLSLGSASPSSSSLSSKKKKCLLRTTCFFEEHEHTQNYGMWLLGPRRNPIFMETAPCYLPMAPGCPWVAWGFVPRLSLENCCGLSRLGAQDTATAHQRPEHAGIFVSHSQHTGKTPENQN